VPFPLLGAISCGASTEAPSSSEVVKKEAPPSSVVVKKEAPSSSVVVKKEAPTSEVVKQEAPTSEAMKQTPTSLSETPKRLVPVTGDKVDHLVGTKTVRPYEIPPDQKPMVPYEETEKEPPVENKKKEPSEPPVNQNPVRKVWGTPVKYKYEDGPKVTKTKHWPKITETVNNKWKKDGTLTRTTKKLFVEENGKRRTETEVEEIPASEAHKYRDEEE
jgi:hypothetical protein